MTVARGDVAYLTGRYFRELVGWGSALVILVLTFAGLPTLAGYVILPAIVLTIAAPWLASLIWG